MTDTIELLETIGKDASLRNASGEHLAQVLEGANASDALKQAVVSGDHTYLAREPGFERLATLNSANNVSQTVPDEEEEEEGGDEPDTSQ